MPTYLYKGINEDGFIMSGAKKTQTITDMKKYLETKRIFEYEIYDTKTNYKEGSYALVSPGDLAVFCQEMHLLFSSHLTLFDGLYVIMSQTENEELKTALEEIYLYMEGGYSFSDAINMYNHIFPHYMLNMIVLGENSSTLDTVFSRMADYFNHESKIRRKVKNSIKYPAVLTGAVSMLSLFTVFLILPYFERSLISMGGHATGFSAFIFGFGKIFKIVIPILIILFIGAYFFLKFYKKGEKGRLFVDKLKISIPVVKDIYLKTALAKICESLSILIRNGVYILDAMDEVVQSVDNTYIRQELNQISNKVKAGEDFINVVEKSEIFPDTFIRMVTVGQTTGHVDDMLLSCAQIFTNDVDKAAEKLNLVYEPAIMAAVSIITGLVIIAVMVPIVNILTLF